MHNRRRIMIPILLVILLAAAGAWYFTHRGSAEASGTIKASGTVEAVEVTISPEISGRVTDVLAGEGERISAGDPLLRLDDLLLKSQRQRAVDALGAAQANQITAITGLSLAKAAFSSAQANAEAVAASSRVEQLAAEQALNALHENSGVARAQAEQAVAVANRAVREAQYQIDNYTVPLSQKDMSATEAIAETEKRLDEARANFEPYKYYPSSDPEREDRKEKLDEAQSDYDDAIRRMEYEAELTRARAALDKASQDLAKLENGPDPDQEAILKARIDAAIAAPKQAASNVEQAQAGVEQAQARLDQAVAAIQQAQAEVDLADVQLEKVVVYAPRDGVVLTRSVEPGEVVQAGAPLMRLGQLDNLKLTVYVPEDRYGQISLGQPAQVVVDSYPGETFSATVVHIADQAEFTPRNVQTPDGRRTTVFAVELAIDNLDGKLKPGMPADVTFGSENP
jgi:membrane fusion protein YbhG